MPKTARTDGAALGTELGKNDTGTEWPTLAVAAATYTLWALGTTLAYTLSPALAILLTGIAIAQFSSLQHEILHGHPFRSRRWNELLAFPALSLTVPYGRFRDTHLAHHHDPILTDPYDDPESNFCDPAVWATLPAPVRLLMRLNNTLLGRITLGPFLGTYQWLKSEALLVWSGPTQSGPTQSGPTQPAPAQSVRRAWLLHLAGLVPLALWLSVAPMPWWAYLASAYVGHALLKIRTFLEHRAHEAARARTVVVEDRGPLALLYLNNNLHVVHHMHPAVPWYRLPRLYAENRDHYLRRNDGYVYRSYAEIFARYLVRAKDPVPHPLMPAQPSSLSQHPASAQPQA